MCACIRMCAYMYKGLLQSDICTRLGKTNKNISKWLLLGIIQKQEIIINI